MRPALAILLSATLTSIALPTLAQAQCTSSRCHAAVKSSANAHPKVAEGRCLTCHRSSKGQSTLRSRPCSSARPEGATCLGCHKRLRQQLSQAKHVHGPVAVGECRFCHSVHDGVGKRRLAARGDALCFRCHDAKRISRTKKHDAARKRCLSCHDAHAGKTYALVR